MALILYTLTLDKTHDIAMLKLMGARKPVVIGLILQQALLLVAWIRIAYSSGNGSSAISAARAGHDVRPLDAGRRGPDDLSRGEHAWIWKATLPR